MIMQWLVISDSMAKQNSNPGSTIYHCRQVTTFLCLSLLVDKMGMTVLLQRAAVTVKEKISMKPLGQCLTQSKHPVVLIIDTMVPTGTLHTFDAISGHEETSTD